MNTQTKSRDSQTVVRLWLKAHDEIQLTITVKRDSTNMDWMFTCNDAFWSKFKGLDDRVERLNDCAHANVNLRNKKPSSTLPRDDIRRNDSRRKRGKTLLFA